MGYNITIGQAVLDSVDDEYDTHYRVTVEGTEVADAPEWPGGDISGKSNSRYPSYTTMAEWARAVGLHDLFHGREEGLLSEHPGCAVLRPAHAAALAKAEATYRAAHPTARPGWGEDGDPGSDPTLARLVWFRWWMEWALANCSRPAVHNS